MISASLILFKSNSMLMFRWTVELNSNWQFASTPKGYCLPGGSFHFIPIQSLFTNGGGGGDVAPMSQSNAKMLMKTD